jgi:acetoacetyl-CoA reductase
MAGRLAYVTGGMGGIGTAISRRLCREGFRVVAGCGPGSPRKDRWIADMRAQGFEVHASEGNVADWESTRAAFEKVRNELGPVDVLVNNAGVTADGTFRKMTFERWHKVIDTNLNSLFHVTKQVIDGMLDRSWGRIINISSVNGQKGQFGQTNYSTAKAGIHGFTMALAQEVASRGVTVNTVSPGPGDEAGGPREDRRHDPGRAARHAGGDRLDRGLARVRGRGIRDRRRLLAERRPAHGMRTGRPDR